ncbi:hypothetical protein Tco_0005518 [Tanacetum coccineum]
MSTGGSTMASYEDINSFLARNTPPDHLIRTYFEQIGVVPKVVFNILEKLVLLLGQHPFNNEIPRVEENPPEKSRLGIFFSKEIFKGGVIRIHNAFVQDELVNVPVPLDHFPVNALTGKVFPFMVKKGKHFSGKVTPLFASMLIQSTEDEGATSERPSEPQPTPSPPHPREANVEPQFDPSPGPSPTPHIPDSILEVSGGNQGGQSSSDRSLSGTEGGMTLQSVYDLCISLYTHVTDQDKEIKHLKARIKNLKKQAKPVITHHRAWLKSVSLKQRLARKKSLKSNWMQKESVSKQGRKSAKDEPSVHKDPVFDELDDDEIDNMDIEDVQDVGRTRNGVNAEKEGTEDAVSTDKEKVSTDRSKDSTDKEKEGTDKEKDSTDKEKDSTDKEKEGTDKEKDSTVSLDEGTDDRTEARSATSTTPTTTPTMFGDDETIAQKHSDLKSKTFEEIQALYEKVKRFDESFTAVGSTEDERRIKEMNVRRKDTD